jgi:hypothetical protein
MFDRKNYMRRYQREWMAARRAKFFLDKRCVICGGTEKLELHHKNPALKVSHKIWSWAKERQLVELEKCEVRCRKHHRESGSEHALSRIVPLIHGTTGGYKKCHCPKCCAAVALQKAAWRKRVGRH